jgi:hypothetical protein
MPETELFRVTFEVERQRGDDTNPEWLALRAEARCVEVTKIRGFANA